MIIELPCGCVLWAEFASDDLYEAAEIDTCGYHTEVRAYNDRVIRPGDAIALGKKKIQKLRVLSRYL